MTVSGPKRPGAPVPQPPATTLQPATEQPQPGSTGAAETAAPVSSTAPVPGDRDVGVRESGGAGGVVDRARDLAGRGVDKLREMAWDEIRSAHDFGTSFSSHGVGLGIRVYEDILTDDQLTPLQKRTVERMEAENPGKKVRFVETRGLMKPSVGISRGGIGGVGAAVGFNASAPVEYRATRPYVFEGEALHDLVNGDNARAIGKILKDNTLDLPHTSEDVMKMPPGSKMELIGKGTFSVSASVGAGVGESGSMGPVEWHAGADVRAGVTRTGSATLANTIEVREDNQVYMKNAVVDDKARSAWINANAGLRVEVDGVLDEIPGLASAGSLADMVTGRAADAVEDKVKELTAFHAHADLTHAERRSKVNAFNLDFNNPDARRLFDDTNRLKTKSFSDAAGRAGSGVSEAQYVEDTDSHSRGAEARFAGKRLFLYRALAQEKEGRLETSDGTTAITRSGRYEKERDVLGWKRKVTGEGAHITKTSPDGAVEKQDFFHGTYDQYDRVPRDSEVGTLRNFVGGLGIEGVEKIQPTDTNFIESLFGHGDNLQIGLDLYISREGLGKIADASPEQIRSAYAESMATLDPELTGIKVNDAEAAGLARRYAELEGEVNRSGDDRSRLEWQMRELAKEYAQRVGSDLRGWRAEKLLKQHLPVFEGADNAAKLIGEAARNRDEGRWTHFVPDIMKENGFMYDSGTLTLMNLAGRDEMLIHGLSIKTEDGTMSLKSEDEGTLRHPMADVNEAIDRP